MKENILTESQPTRLQNLEELLNPEESLYKISNKMAWKELEEEFALYIQL